MTVLDRIERIGYGGLSSTSAASPLSPLVAAAASARAPSRPPRPTETTVGVTRIGLPDLAEITSRIVIDGADFYDLRLLGNELWASDASSPTLFAFDLDALGR